MLHSSGHAAQVDGDRFADNMNADLCGINAESKYSWPHEVDLFHAAYDGTLSLRVVDEAKGVWKNMGLARGKGRLAKEKEKERRGGSSLYKLDLVIRSQMGEKLLL